MSETTTTRNHKFHAGQKCRIIGGRCAGLMGVIKFDEPIIGCANGDEWFVEIEGLGREVRERDMEPVEDEPSAGKPEPAARNPESFPAGARIRHTLLDRTGTVQEVYDATWRITRFDGDKKSWFCSVDYLEELPGVAEPEPAAHRWAVGDRVKVVAGPFAGARGRIREVACPTLFFVSCDDGRSIAAYPEDVELDGPEPATYRWAAGDRARVDQPSHGQHGSDVILVRRHFGEIVRKPYWEYATDGDHGRGFYVYEEYLVPVPEPEPPTLYRVEYAVIDDATPGDPDGDGDYPPLSLVTSRRAALVPIAGAAERVKLAEVLEILHDAEDGHDDFLIGQIGGIPADPYAVGDRVAIVGGEHHGQGFYLIERDAGNSQRWWLSRRKDGDGWIGLHVDRFERDERGDG